MSIRTIFRVLAVVFPFISYAQNAGDAISVNGLNEKFLEHLIKEKIDNVRSGLNLLPLANDSVLFIAAKHHASYLFNKGELSHFEPEDKKRETPQKRADYFGAINYLVGENVALTYVNIPAKDKKGKSYTNETYEQTATDFVTMWVNSPGHYKNIITPDYNATGLAIWVDSKTNRIYGVQKFATILFKYKFDENKSLFPYSTYVSPALVKSFQEVGQTLHKGKHAHNLKVPKEASCIRCTENKPAFAFGLTGVEERGGSIYLTSYSYTAILNLLKKRRDGFAAEIVRYNPYDCGNPEYYTLPSRKNKQCLFSGKVLKPVYKKKALKGFRPSAKNRKKIKEKIENGKVKKYMLKLGKVPKDMSGYYEVNLVVIQKKKVCDVMHFSAFCGDTLDKFYPMPFYPDSVSNTYVLQENYQNTAFSIPFKKGKTEYNRSDIKPITDSLLSENFIADTITIKAFSSVEGTETGNKLLQEQRAKNIATVISLQQKEKLNTKIFADENWVMFEKQIESNKELQAYKGLTREKVKEKLTDTIEQKRIEPFLAKQRVANIVLHAKQVINDNTIEKYIAKKIKTQKARLIKYIASDNKKDSTFIYVDSLQFYMGVTYNSIKKGIIKPDFFGQFDIGTEPILNSYNLLKLKYWIQIDEEGTNPAWRKKVYSELVNLYNKNNRSFFVNFNMLNIIQKSGNELNVSISDTQKDQYISELRMFQSNENETQMVDKLAINFWFSICQLPEYEQSKNNVQLYRKGMAGIHDYFKNRSLETEELNKLAKFYIFHCRADWAYEILAPEFEQKKNNPEGLKLLAKLLYQNYEETHDVTYYQFLEQVYDRIGKDAWCPMFVGPCNVSFQVFDYEPFRNFYCEKCSTYMNYAKTPVTEK